MQFNIRAFFFLVCVLCVCSDVFFQQQIFLASHPSSGLFVFFAFFFLWFFCFFFFVPDSHTSMHNTNSKKEKGKGQKKETGEEIAGGIILNCRVERGTLLRTLRTD